MDIHGQVNVLNCFFGARFPLAFPNVGLYGFAPGAPHRPKPTQVTSSDPPSNRSSAASRDGTGPVRSVAGVAHVADVPASAPAVFAGTWEAPHGSTSLTGQERSRG